MLDLWCTLRVRSGAMGIGLEALGKVFRNYLQVL